MDVLVAEPLTRFIAQVVVVVALARIIGLGARRLGQPMVIAEIVAGILLGPSLLGWLFPDVFAVLFAPGSLGIMSTVSQIGLVLFMFLIGLELDHVLLRGRRRASITISYASMLAPFLLAAALALYLYPRFAGGSVSLTTFVMFMGASMSVTAFPVLARILAERQLLRSRLGAVTIACAAVDDVTAWCILAFVVASARAAGIADGLVTTALAVGYVALMLGLVRPLLVRLAARVASPEAMSANLVAVVLVLLLLSSLATELIGIHALFGAFLFGAILPKSGGFARALVEKLEGLVVIALVPLFFAFSGLRTEIGLLDSAYHWGICGLLVLVATLGKAGGGALAARFSGMSWREAGALGVLMNTRGLMGVIVLNIGLDLGVISPALFSMMVITALVTTLIATPLLERIYPAGEMARDLVESLETAPAPAKSPETRMLVCVSHVEAAPGLVAMARALGRGDGGARIDALHLVATCERPPLHLTEDLEDGAPRALRAAMASAAEFGIDVRPLSFVSADPAEEICRVASVRDSDLVLLGAHHPAAGIGALGGVVAAVMRRTAANVAVFVDRGFREPRRVLVPFRGPDDRAALFLARRLARAAGGTVTVLHAGSAREPDERADDVDFESVDRLSLAEVTVARAADGYNLVVAGLGSSDRRTERLVRDLYPSLLLIRGLPRAVAAAREG